jgi:hypothetical protein
LKKLRAAKVGDTIRVTARVSGLVDSYGKDQVSIVDVMLCDIRSVKIEQVANPKPPKVKPTPPPKPQIQFVYVRQSVADLIQTTKKPLDKLKLVKTKTVHGKNIVLFDPPAKRRRKRRK